MFKPKAVHLRRVYRIIFIDKMYDIRNMIFMFILTCLSIKLFSILLIYVILFQILLLGFRLSCFLCRIYNNHTFFW